MCPISPATGFSLAKFNSWGNSWIQLRVGFSKETQEREREAKTGRVRAKMVRLKNDCRSGSMDRVRDLEGRGSGGQRKRGLRARSRGKAVQFLAMTWVRRCPGTIWGGRVCWR